MQQPTFGYLIPENGSLFTDLYELRMMQAYFTQDHNPTATFSLFFRDLPPNREYMIAAGLEQALAVIEDISFSERELEYLAELDFNESFLSHLSNLEFTGDVRAMPEGTPVFANEPMVEVTAPILQAQFLETALINQMGYQTMIATKACRMRDVIDRRGEDQRLVDFGSRRAHGTDAGIKAARAAYIGGFAGTSNVAAGELFDLPVFGTMAHSWVQSFPEEREAFERFIDEFGEDSILLIDTYDTIEGARTAREVVEETGTDIRGVRLDSGDLPALSKDVDREAPDLATFISSGIDEYAISEFYDRGGIATGFGPGTALVTSSDSPEVTGVYKLVAVERDGEMQPTMKLSTGKVTYPGAKQVWRTVDAGTYAGDVIGFADGEVPAEETSATPLLETVVKDGDLVWEPPGLDAIRKRTRKQCRKLPPDVREIEDAETYPVRVSDAVERLRRELQSRLEAKYDG